MTSVDSNFNFLCGRSHGAWPPIPMRPPEPDPSVWMSYMDGPLCELPLTLGLWRLSEELLLIQEFVIKILTIHEHAEESESVNWRSAEFKTENDGFHTWIQHLRILMQPNTGILNGIASLVFSVDWLNCCLNFSWIDAESNWWCSNIEQKKVGSWKG